MAKEAIVVCESYFQSECEGTRLLAFRQKWLKLICQLEKSYLYPVQKGVQTIAHK